MRGKGLLAPQNTFLDTIATRFDGTRKYHFLNKVTNMTFCEISLWFSYLETNLNKHQ